MVGWLRLWLWLRLSLWLCLCGCVAALFVWCSQCAWYGAAPSVFLMRVVLPAGRDTR